MPEQKQTFDESQLPEWAVHGSSDQEDMDAFFNSPADRGRSETVFAIPRGDSDEVAGDAATSHAPDKAPADSAVPAPAEAAQASKGADAQPVNPAAVAGQVSQAAAASASQVAADSVSQAAATTPEAQDASDQGLPSADGAVAQDGGAADAVEGQGEEAPSGSAGFGFGKKSGEQEAPTPRREDFAKFRCIYESHDGQLALYEDEDGHLTAVNTNRFV